MEIKPNKPRGDSIREAEFIRLYVKRIRRRFGIPMDQYFEVIIGVGLETAETRKTARAVGAKAPFWFTVIKTPSPNKRKRKPL